MKRTAISLSIFMSVFVLLSSFSNDTGRSNPVFQQVLWSRTDSSYNNFRIPAVIVTEKGTVLAFAEGREGGDAGNIDILLKRSGDNGLTWSEQTIVWDDGPNTCGNPCPVVDQTTGRIILFMTWNLGSDHEDKIIRKKSTNTRKPFMCYSDDDGLTWSKPVEMSNSFKDPEWGWYATGPVVGIQQDKFRRLPNLDQWNTYS